MSELPVGTVTFLFTDLEGSTRLWQEHPDSMKGALARHDEILHDVVASHEGHVVKTTGDGVHAAFADAAETGGEFRGFARAPRQHVAPFGLLFDQNPARIDPRRVQRRQPDVAVAFVEKVADVVASR